MSKHQAEIVQSLKWYSNAGFVFVEYLSLLSRNVKIFFLESVVRKTFWTLDNLNLEKHFHTRVYKFYR